MKTSRQSKIIEIIQKNEVETQEELSALLESEGFRVTQATVSRDIRELKLTKIPIANGRRKSTERGLHFHGYGAEYSGDKDSIRYGECRMCGDRCHGYERNRRFDSR